MKNFFKKLSFVLAIAMVLTSIAPATASAAEISAKFVPAKKVNVKNVNGEKITSIELGVEETKNVKLGLPVTKAAKEAGFTKTTFATAAFSADETVAEVVKVSKKVFEITGVAAGETTITFGAAKTPKKAKAGEFKKTFELPVTVVANNEIAAEQAGVAKIRVTGSDLTIDAADYVVKKGTASITPVIAYETEDSKDSVILTMPTKLGKNTYTVAYKDGEAVTVETELGVIDQIVFTSETAIATSVSNNAIDAAKVYYKVLNQFEENITDSTSIGTTMGNDLMVSGAPGTLTPVKKDGVINITNIPAANGIVNVSTITLNIVSTSNGRNVTGTFTLSNKAALSSVELLGIYKADLTGNMVPATMTVGDTATDYYLLIDAKDQYGVAITTGTDSVLNLPGNGFFTISTKSAVAPKTVNGVPYLTYQVVAIGNVAGTANVVGVCTNNGATSSISVTVNPMVQIKTFTASPVDGNVLYGSRPVEFEYTAIDSEGNEVTNFSALNSSMKVSTTTNGQTDQNKQLPAGFKWVRQADGSAKLYFTPVFAGTDAKNEKEYTNMNLSFWTPLMGYSNTMVTVYETPVAKAIVGLAAGAESAAIIGRDVKFTLGSFVFADQYDNTMAASQVGSIAVSYSAISGSAVIANKLAGNTPVNGATTSTTVATYTAIASGTEKVTFAIVGLEDSEFTTAIRGAKLDEVSNFAVAAQKLYNVTTSAVTTNDVKVTGYVGDAKLTLVGGVDYAVVTKASGDGKQVVIPANKAIVDGLSEGTVEYTIQVFNTAATELTGSVAYSNAPAALAVVAPLAKADTVTHGAVSGTPILVTDLLGDYASGLLGAVSYASGTTVLYAADQYNNAITPDDLTNVRVNVTVVDADVDGDNAKVKLTVNKNNSTLTTVDVVGAAGQQFILHVDYVFANGLETSADILFEVK